MIGTILVNVDGIILGVDVGTYMGSLDGFFDGSNDGNIEGLLLVGSLGYTYGKFLGSNEGTKLGCTGGKVSATIFRKVDIITLGIDIGTEMGFLDVSFDGSNYGKLEGLFIVYSMGYTGGKVLGSNERIKLVLSGGKMLRTILVNLDGIALGLDVGTEIGYLDGSLDVSNHGKLEGLFISWRSLGYTYGKVLGSYEVIKLGLSDVKVIGTILVNVDVIALGIDVGIELGSLDGSFDGSNDGNLEGLFLGGSL